MSTSPPTLPVWMQESAPYVAPPQKKRRSRRGFLEKTLSAFAEALRSELFSEELARRPGLLQRVDSRVKLLTVFALVGTAAVLHHLLPLLLLNLWLFWLARCSRVPLGVFVKRIWIVVPLFTAIVAFPVLFNIVRPGDPLLVLFHLSHPLTIGPWTSPAEIALTRQGATAAALLVLRVGASVSLAVLLTLTTRWPVLLRGLRALRIPAVFLQVLEMTYRYVFLLLQVSAEMFTARKSRMVGSGTSKEQRRFVAGVMGSLWGRTHALSEEVYHAMMSRGYRGEPRSLNRFALRLSDGLWSAVVLLVMVFLIGGDHVLR